MIKDNERTSRDIEKAYHAKKYILTQKVVYQPFYSVNAGYYAMPVYKKRDAGNLTRPHRFFHLTGDQINDVIGIKLLNNL